MTELAIEVAGVRVEPHAAVPTLVWSWRVVVPEGVRVHALALRAQVRIEPGRRHYDAGEQDRLLTLFGPPGQWGASLHPFLWTHLDAMVAGFTTETVAEVPMSCTYDFEVAASQYLHGLAGGAVPLTILFNGVVFTPGESGFCAEPIAWHVEARTTLPVQLWREMMDRYFPDQGWIRLGRATIDRLRRYRTEQASATWEQAFASLLKQAGEDD
ncbi:MAG: DUF6084 family protein [Acidimicrobiales bacterium]